MSDKMIRLLCVCFVFYALMDSSQGVSTKMDFSDDESAVSIANSTGSDDEDVEVKHTIVVSTKLRNGNRRGLHNTGEGEKGIVTYNIGSRNDKGDSGEVPVIKGYKSVETTEIRTPDTRLKVPIQPDTLFINRNARDEYDIYPNYISNPSQWKPSSYYNNINWLNQDMGRRPAYHNPGKFHRRISDDGVKEFYCRKCRELNNGELYTGCAQQRSNSPRYLYETTTAKIDGKLAKLN